MQNMGSPASDAVDETKLSMQNTRLNSFEVYKRSALSHKYGK